MAAGAGLVGARAPQTMALQNEAQNELIDFEASMKGSAQLSDPQVERFFSLFRRISTDPVLSENLRNFLGKVTGIFVTKVYRSTLQGLPLSTATYFCQMGLVKCPDNAPLFPQDPLRKACLTKDLSATKLHLRVSGFFGSVLSLVRREQGANQNPANIGSGVFPDLTPFQIAQLTCRPSDEDEEDNGSDLQILKELLRHGANPMVGVTTKEGERARVYVNNHPLAFICSFYDSDLVELYFSAGGELPKSRNAQKGISSSLFSPPPLLCLTHSNALPIFKILVEKGIAVGQLALISSARFLLTDEITSDFFLTVANRYLNSNEIQKIDLDNKDLNDWLSKVFCKFPIRRKILLDIASHLLFSRDSLRKACLTKDLNSIRDHFSSAVEAAEQGESQNAPNVGSGVFPDLTPFQIAQLTCNPSDDEGDNGRDVQILKELLRQGANPMVRVSTKTERAGFFANEHPLAFICSFYDGELVELYFRAGGELPESIAQQKSISSFFYDPTRIRSLASRDVFPTFLVLVERGIHVDLSTIKACVEFLHSGQITPEFFLSVASHYLSTNDVQRIDLDKNNMRRLLIDTFCNFPTLREVLLDIGFDPSSCLSDLLRREETRYQTLAQLCSRYREGKNQFWNLKGNPLMWRTAAGILWETLSQAARRKLLRNGYSPTEANS